MTDPPKSVAVTGLVACLLGLIVCPFAYIALGIRAEFSPTFYVVALLPFLLASGFLLWRYLSKPSERTMRRLPALVAEGISWVVVARFLVVVSAINLVRGAERVGVAAQWFLAATAISLPIALTRRTALQRRLASLPKGIVVAALLSILGIAVGALIADAVTPRRFLGDHALGDSPGHGRFSLNAGMAVGQPTAGMP